MVKRIDWILGLYIVFYHPWREDQQRDKYKNQTASDSFELVC